MEKYKVTVYGDFETFEYRDLTYEEAYDEAGNYSDDYVAIVTLDEEVE
ncbi:unnamed protein product [Fructobacillus evanidus]|uniref:Phage protein n=1 Tax=Fructobacillus evanidus TaxID=3064281 RepID=A0ABN9Z4Q3_9LACO|nr:unnamed protein product [Fructobacillus sp. LMG 32999]CAK1231280.1 unnamed protein product [Fructobacillus sp. LMG 32999]CAK1243387.1 unnamed protein product [Fructobacillus sp. LMG 32999]CAK1245069.1 unnamed protein product [Fructobacillus sp. LMG 32999]CAK1254572.1 unnamed protein product [Fructobacillus sp. LMG 32999]